MRQTTLLLYLTKAAPFVHFDEVTKTYVMIKGISGPFNGTVCGACETDKVERITRNVVDLNHPMMQEYFTFSLWEKDLLARSRLTKAEMSVYDPKFAIYLESPKPIVPMPITRLAKNAFSEEDIASHPHTVTLYKDMVRAPQNMCRAYWFRDGDWKQVIVLSVRARFFCDIMNGKKDIEVRRSVLRELKEMAEFGYLEKGNK